MIISGNVVYGKLRAGFLCYSSTGGLSKVVIKPCYWHSTE